MPFSQRAVRDVEGWWFGLAMGFRKQMSAKEPVAFCGFVGDLLPAAACRFAVLIVVGEDCWYGEDVPAG
jgi:hypothetical protein